MTKKRLPIKRITFGLLFLIVMVVLFVLLKDQDLSEEALFQWFSDYAYRPMTVYIAVSLFMLASSFGLPIPEEVVLVSSGLVAHAAQNPVRFPPPYPGAEAVNVYILASVCLLSVFFSDLSVYFIGKYFGRQIVKTNFFKKNIGDESFARINEWFKKYGFWASGIFRFTPGLRFPGHLSCGMLGVTPWQFIAVDGGAALFSVPTQVLLVAFIGEAILDKLAIFKRYFIWIVVIVIALYVLKISYQYLRKRLS